MEHLIGRLRFLIPLFKYEGDNMTTQLWISIIVYALSCGAIYGGLKSEIKALAEKVDKHNHVIERVYELETHNEVMDLRIERLEGESEND